MANAILTCYGPLRRHARKSSHVHHRKSTPNRPPSHDPSTGSHEQRSLANKISELYTKALDQADAGARQLIEDDVERLGHEIRTLESEVKKSKEKTATQLEDERKRADEALSAEQEKHEYIEIDHGYEQEKVNESLHAAVLLEQQLKGTKKSIAGQAQKLVSRRIVPVLASCCQEAQG